MPAEYHILYNLHYDTLVCQVEFRESGKYQSKSMFLSGVFTDEAYFTTESGSIYSNEYKPYLFPLSSMTDEQEEEYNDLNCYELGCFPHTEEALDYLIKNHFDYRGLIEKELAIDATNLNIY